MQEEIDRLNNRVDGIDDKFKSVLESISETSVSIQELTNELKLDRKDYEITREALVEVKAINEKLVDKVTNIEKDLIPLKLIQNQFIESDKKMDDMKLKVVGAVVSSVIAAFLLGKFI